MTSMLYHEVVSEKNSSQINLQTWNTLTPSPLLTFAPPGLLSDVPSQPVLSSSTRTPPGEGFAHDVEREGVY